MTVQTSIVTTIDAPVEQTFKVATAFDPRDLIRKYGPLPSIEAVEGNTGPWSEIGQKRVYLLSNNTSACEELTGITDNFTYAYKVTDFTGGFGSLIDHARAEWHFTQLSATKTQIDWTYFFTAKNAFTEPVLWTLIKVWWPGYLRAALGRVKTKSEGAHKSNAPSF